MAKPNKKTAAAALKKPPTRTRAKSSKAKVALEASPEPELHQKAKKQSKNSKAQLDNEESSEEEKGSGSEVGDSGDLVEESPTAYWIDIWIALEKLTVRITWRFWAIHMA